jgi:hypothetical protein
MPQAAQTKQTPMKPASMIPASLRPVLPQAGRMKDRSLQARLFLFP